MVAYQHYAVPGNSSRLPAFAQQLRRRWQLILSRRSQRSRGSRMHQMCSLRFYRGRFSDGCPAFWLRGFKPARALRSLVKSKRSAIKATAVITSAISRRGRFGIPDDLSILQRTR
jgi:hypothetical protein